jgi:hypothetical protein
LVLLSIFSFANTTAQELEIGAKAGLNFTSIYGDNTDDTGSLTPFNFGLMAEYHFSNKLSFQPEILFSGQGYDLDNTSVALNYLNLPL